MAETVKIPASKNVLIVAGDVSGDVHASNLVRSLKEIRPDLHITAMGGQRVKKVADTFLFDLASQGASGFIEPFKKIPLWYKLLRMVREYMDTQYPACVIVVDFYGFNSQVLGMARHRNIPCYYYVAPQVWASRQYRTKTLARSVKKSFVIYPFEPAFHEKYGSNAVFLGNPLLDKMPEPKENLFDGTYQLGLLPGSRSGELKKHLKMFYQAYKEVLKAFPTTKCYVFCVEEFSDDYYYNLIGVKDPNVILVRETDYALRSEMDFLITCSGTATLENALLGVPMLVAYKMSWLTYHIAKAVIKVKYISLVNLLVGKEVVKEFIQDKANARNISAEVMSFFQNPKKGFKMRDELLEIRASLGEPGVAMRAAKMITEEIFPS